MMRRWVTIAALVAGTCAAPAVAKDVAGAAATASCEDGTRELSVTAAQRVPDDGSAPAVGAPFYVRIAMQSLGSPCSAFTEGSSTLPEFIPPAGVEVVRDNAWPGFAETQAWGGVATRLEGTLTLTPTDLGGATVLPAGEGERQSFWPLAAGGAVTLVYVPLRATRPLAGTAARTPACAATPTRPSVVCARADAGDLLQVRVQHSPALPTPIVATVPLWAAAGGTPGTPAPGSGSGSGSGPASGPAPGGAPAAPTTTPGASPAAGAAPAPRVPRRATTRQLRMGLPVALRGLPAGARVTARLAWNGRLLGVARVRANRAGTAVMRVFIPHTFGRVAGGRVLAVTFTAPGQPVTRRFVRVR